MDGSQYAFRAAAPNCTISKALSPRQKGLTQMLIMDVLSYQSCAILHTGSVSEDFFFPP